MEQHVSRIRLGRGPGAAFFFSWECPDPGVQWGCVRHGVLHCAFGFGGGLKSRLRQISRSRTKRPANKNIANACCPALRHTQLYLGMGAPYGQSKTGKTPGHGAPLLSRPRDLGIERPPARSGQAHVVNDGLHRGTGRRTSLLAHGSRGVVRAIRVEDAAGAEAGCLAGKLPTTPPATSSL